MKKTKYFRSFSKRCRLLAATLCMVCLGIVGGRPQAAALAPLSGLSQSGGFGCGQWGDSPGQVRQKERATLWRSEEGALYYLAREDGQQVVRAYFFDEKGGLCRGAVFQT